MIELDTKPVINFCGRCGELVYPKLGGYKCVWCGCMSFPVEVNAIKIDENTITFEPYIALNPIF